MLPTASVRFGLVPLIRNNNLLKSSSGAALFATKEEPQHPKADTSADPLKADPRTTKSQQVAHDTDEATKDSIRHAADGEFVEAAKDVGRMAKNAAQGAVESSKLMMDSKGHASKETRQDLEEGEKPTQQKKK